MGSFQGYDFEKGIALKELPSVNATVAIGNDLPSLKALGTATVSTSAVLTMNRKQIDRIEYDSSRWLLSDPPKYEIKIFYKDGTTEVSHCHTNSSLLYGNPHYKVINTNPRVN